MNNKKDERIDNSQIAYIEMIGDVFSKITESILITDMQKKIVEWNGSSEKLFGIPKNDIIGRNMDCIISPDLEENDIIKIINKINNEPFILKLISKSIISNNIVYILHDITKQERLNQFLDTYHDELYSGLDNLIKEKTKELEELNESLEHQIEQRTHEVNQKNKKLLESYAELEKTQDQLIHSQKLLSLGGFVAGLSHKLNTNLGVAMTACTFLKDEISNISKIENENISISQLIERAERFSDSNNLVCSNLHSAASIITTLKRYADLIKNNQDNTEKEKWEILDFEKIVLFSTAKFEELRRGGNHSFEIINEYDINVLINKQSIMEEIFEILLENAFKHGFQGLSNKTIKISIKHIKADNLLVIVISNNGKHISRSIVKHIFDPYFTTHFGQGNGGIGLSIVYSIVVGLLEGEIECHSNKSEGTKFTIKLPIGSDSIKMGS